MSTKLAKMVADFQTTLATELAVGGTGCTIQSIVDDDGVNIPDGVYFFTLDRENSQKEHFTCTLTAGVLSAMSSISRQGAQTSGAVRKHRIGASVTITDFAHLMYINNLFRGTDLLDHTTPLIYDGDPGAPSDYELVTKAYVAGVAIAGAPNMSTTINGISQGATGADLAAGTSVGSTGALLVALASSFKTISAGAGDVNKVPTANASGVLDQSWLDAARTWTTLQQFSAATIALINPPGLIGSFAVRSVPIGWLVCDGSAVSRATYASLFAALNPSLGTVTITIAVPGVVSLTAHGMATGDAVYITTTGSLPTGLTANTQYWVIKNDANSFWLATSLANALAGTKITTTGTQAGTHTMRSCAWGVGDGSTTFNVPDLKAQVIVGKDQANANFAGLGQTYGEATHTLTTPEIPAHTHSSQGNGGGSIAAGVNFGFDPTPTGSAGGGGAHNNIQPSVAMLVCVKT